MRRLVGTVTCIAVVAWGLPAGAAVTSAPVSTRRISPRSAAPAVVSRPPIYNQWGALQAVAAANGDHDSDVAADGTPTPDAIPDSVERVFGTNPKAADTDSDTLPDGNEVAWGLDPQQPDSNFDGIPDNIEIGLDAQGNPTRAPDAWIDDNDADGVVDRVDLSPFGRAPDSSEALNVDVQTAGGATNLDFQVVPSDQQRLQKWLARSVLRSKDASSSSQLDWQDGDSAGVMQDRNASSEDVGLTPVLEVDVGDRARYETDAARAALAKYSVVIPEEIVAGADGLRVTYRDLDGDGTVDDLAFTGERLAPLTSVVGLTAGAGHTCALTGNATNPVWCWGDNRVGQLGTGAPGSYLSRRANGTIDVGAQSESWPTGMVDPAPEPYPVKLPWDDLPPATASSVSSSGNHTCFSETGPATGTAGKVSCWGFNSYGQADQSQSPRNALLPRDAGLALAAGTQHLTADAGGTLTCHILGSGQDSARTVGVACNGRNDAGQLGRGGTSTPQASPALVTKLVLPGGTKVPFVLQRDQDQARMLSTGDANSCAIVNVEWQTGNPVYPESGRRLACWGENAAGQSSPATAPVDTLTPRVVELAGGARPAAVAAGAGLHACVITTAGAVQCWGADDAGQVSGSGTTHAGPVPPTVVALPLDVANGEAPTALGVGAAHSCVATSKARLLCWGANDRGQLGTGAVSATAQPVTVVDLPIGDATISSLAVGNRHTCVATDDGAAWCWGADDRGQLGIGVVTGSVPVPTRVGERHRLVTTGRNVDLLRSPGAEGSLWTPLSERDLPASADIPVPAGFPGLGAGTTDPISLAADLDGDGGNDAIVWARVRSTERLQYRTYRDGVWSPLRVGPVLAPGRVGNALTVADVDHEGARDIVYTAVDDLDRRSYRLVVGFDGGTRWGDVGVHRGSSAANLLYVPLVPQLDQVGAITALMGRMFVPGASAPDLHLRVRLVWIVEGRSDDPDLAATAADGPATGEQPVVLARYPDRFSLTGFEATEHVRADVAAFTPSGFDDEGARWTAGTRTSLELSEPWMMGTGRDRELPLAGVANDLAAKGISVAGRSGSFAHEDEAMAAAETMAEDLLSDAPPGRMVPVSFAVERELRSIELGVDPLASWTDDGSLAVALDQAHTATLKTFDANYYDTTGDEPKVLTTELLDRLREWGFGPEVESRLAALLVSWDVGETVIAAVDGQEVGRTGSLDSAAVAFDTVMEHWAWKLIGAAPIVDAANGLSGVEKWVDRMSVVTRPRANATATVLLDGTKSAMDAASRARLAQQAVKLGRGWTFLKKAMGQLEHIGTIAEVGLIAVTFLVSFALDHTAYGTAAALADLVVATVEFVAAELATVLLSSSLALIPALAAAESNPAGWIATVIVAAILVTLYLLEYFGVVKWQAAFKDWVLGIFTDSEQAVYLRPGFEDLAVSTVDGDGGGLTVGDAVGVTADLFNREYPRGAISTGALFGNTGTWLWDMSLTWFGAGLWATAGEAKAGIEKPDPRQLVRDWSGDLDNLFAPRGVTAAPPTAAEPNDPAPHRIPVAAWVATSRPSPDFPVSFSIETRAEIAGIECAVGSGCYRSFYDLGGEPIEVTESPASKFAEPTVMHFDVLPGSLDGFLQWSDVVTPLDADGDGILDSDEVAATSSTKPGMPDTDGDGVTDGAELVLKTDPARPDTDRDDLVDGDELMRGTDPKRSDSDDDGLSDREEIDGWDIGFVFGGQPFTTHVTSDPLDPDTDANHLGGDGLDDRAERDRGLNPRSSDTDGDGRPDGGVVSIGDALTVEGDSGLHIAKVPVSLSRPAPGRISVTYRTVEGSAKPGSDFRRIREGSLTFLPGQVLQHVTVVIRPDVQEEGDETFSVALGTVSNAVMGRASGTVTISDDEPGLGDRIAIGDAAVVEGDATGRAVGRVVQLIVGLAHPVTAAVPLTWVTFDGDATGGAAGSGADYVSSGGVLTIRPGDSYGVIRIPLMPDRAAETDEYFNVRISGPSGIVRDPGQVHILDDDRSG